MALPIQVARTDIGSCIIKISFRDGSSSCFVGSMRCRLTPQTFEPPPSSKMVSFFYPEFRLSRRYLHPIRIPRIFRAVLLFFFVAPTPITILALDSLIDNRFLLADASPILQPTAFLDDYFKKTTTTQITVTT